MVTRVIKTIRCSIITFAMAFLAVLLVLAAVTFAEQARTSVTEDLRMVATSNNNFTLKFAKYLKQKSSGDNVIFSSISASSVLAGLAEGAVGHTRSQLLTALDLPDNDDYIRSGYRTIITSYDSSLNGNVTLNTADAIFLANQFTPKESFVSTMQRDFKSEVQTVDFASGSSAEDTINTWVSQHTNGKIEKLYEGGALDSSTLLVLANAVYFKGTWKTAFSEGSTYKKTFYLSSTSSVEVDMMNLESDFVVYSDNNLQANVLEMPYAGEKVKMLIVLPFETDGLDSMLKKLSGIPKPNGNVYATTYKIHIPKFKITSTMDVSTMLQSFGVTDAFTSAADFSKISDETISVDSVKQKAYVEVNEEGTEAAAATGAGAGETSIDQPPPEIPEFNANHPFLYFIVHVPTDTAVFSGYILNPGQ